MIQAMTQGRSIPGLMEYIYQGMAFSNELLPFIIEAQKSGEAEQGDPDLLMLAYVSLVQGLALLSLDDDGITKKITPEIFTKVLRNTGDKKK
jgi:hypothetical protein